MELKGSRTEQNLLKAFAGESQARNKYTYFASAAKREGYEQVADVFLKSAENEKEHAKIWFKYLSGGNIGSTKENLQEAIDGEHAEWTSMYEEFAKTAKEEGFLEIAEKFLLTAKVEKSHEGRFAKFLGLLNSGSLHKSDADSVWVCKNCGHIHYGKEAPQVCPLCNHSRGYFELRG